MPVKTSPTTTREATTERKEAATAPPMNKVERMIRVGKRPLQGIKLFVKMAMSRSLGDSMIRQEITPAALQPKPMLMVRDCLPWAPARRKNLSRLKATRGR